MCFAMDFPLGSQISWYVCDQGLFWACAINVEATIVDLCNSQELQCPSPPVGAEERRGEELPTDSLSSWILSTQRAGCQFPCNTVNHSCRKHWKYVAKLPPPPPSKILVMALALLL